MFLLLLSRKISAKKFWMSPVYDSITFNLDNGINDTDDENDIDDDDDDDDI